MSILVRRQGETWHEPQGSGYTDESALQSLIFEHPALVPGVSGDAIAVREFQSGIGPADVVILDSEGALTLVECKLGSNADIRRKIVGQVLDYASRVWRMPVSDFEAAWCLVSAGHVDPFEQLEDSQGRIREALAANLAAGRFNLVLAVDVINDDLRRIVEYLNEVTKPDTGVMLVEFTRFDDGDLEILMPVTYGQELVEAKADSTGSSSRPRWTVQQYLDWCDANDPGSAATMRALIEALEVAGFTVAGGQAVTPSLNCGIRMPGLGPRWPICLYTAPGRGALVEIRFNDLKAHPEQVAKFAHLVCSVPGVPLTEAEVEAAGYRKKPNIPAAHFTPETAAALARAVALMGAESDRA